MDGENLINSNSNSINFSEIAQNEKIDSQIIAKNKIEEIKIKEKQDLINPMLKAMENENYFSNNLNKNLFNNNNTNLYNYPHNSNIQEMHLMNNLNKFYNPFHNENNQNASHFQNNSSLSQISINSSSSFHDGITNINYISTPISQNSLEPIEPLIKHSNSENIQFNFRGDPELYNYNNNNSINKGEVSMISNGISSKSIKRYNPSKIKEEQEKYDKNKKSSIIEMHGKKLMNYYEYAPKEKENNIMTLLKNMNYFGEIMKNEIINEKNLNNYITTEKAMILGNDTKNQEYKNEFFVLACLSNALSFQGCKVLIEKVNPTNDEKIKELNTTIQFLANGMYNLKKYTFYFDLGEEKIIIILNNMTERINFNSILKNKLKQLFNLQENDIILTNPRFAPNYSINAIIRQSKFNELPNEDLFKILKNDPYLNKIINIQKNILLSGCKLNPYMLDSRGNNKDGGWGYNEIRGGAPYYPPNGWVGYGLRVADRYDNGDNSWLDYNHSEGEWSVAYHGIGGGLKGNQLFNTKTSHIVNNLLPGINQQFKNNMDLFNLGKKVGEGIIVTPKPTVMEEYCGIFDCYGKRYKIGFMTRVMPKKIRFPDGQDDFWVINGTDNEVRPYRILIKEL